MRTNLSTSGSTAPDRTAKLRSKTKILTDGAGTAIWGVDGSSTKPSPGQNRL